MGCCSAKWAAISRRRTKRQLAPSAFHACCIVPNGPLNSSESISGSGPHAGCTPGKRPGRNPWLVSDESSWAKPESIAPEEYGPVRSSKANRLTRIKKGYYTPPHGPIFVPGLHWLAVILVGRNQQDDPPELASMGWWTSRGPRES